MDTRSQILRWREIVHPLFWPVFFWNLWKFAATLARKIETRGNGLIGYEITWWGGIRIHKMIDPDAPQWDVGLEECAQRVHLATLDVGNPYLSAGVPFSLEGEGLGVRAPDLSKLPALANLAPRTLTLTPSPGGRRTHAELAMGCFAEPAHLNTS